MFESMGHDISDPTADWMRGMSDWYDRKLRTDSFAAFVAQQENTVAGGCSVWLLDGLPRTGNPSGLRAYVGGMYVYPSARGQGVARQLLAAVLDWSRTKGIGIAELHATSMGAPLYESVGFQPATNYRLPL
ncbi:hypothetical protein GCM10009765_74510 [Fodinicola feengrottensis]|uniref:N-acetyltransferase domain-containing protein n=2 Tax=Fodinicola feengrottensis TaxID=435914 RepID=A0ABN2J013_9ACTN